MQLGHVSRGRQTGRWDNKTGRQREKDDKQRSVKKVSSQVVTCVLKMERLARSGGAPGGASGGALVNPTLVRYRRHGMANTADPNQQ